MSYNGTPIVLGTPASGVLTNCTGTASGLTAGNVTTNANLTGVITSVGNATSIASQTGTGTKFVVDTSPTLVTPVLGAASATSLTLTSTTGIVGTTTNDSASAGSVGEYISSNIASGSAVSLVTGTEKTITSISLTAGDWDVSINGAFNGGPTTNVNQFGVSISTTNNVGDYTLGRGGIIPFGSAGVVVFVTNQYNVNIPQVRISLSGTTTIYFVAFSTFSISTCTAFGIIAARRVR